MPHTPQHPDNPCSLPNAEQIPAKIWELLRRNNSFRAEVQRLREVDAEARNREKEGHYHSRAWNRSYRLVKRIEEDHPFAGLALQWLVPDPLFHCEVVAWPRGEKWKKLPACAVRYLRVGEGRSPDVKDKNWIWRNPNEPDTRGHLMVRGPEIHWTQSRFKRLRSKVNPLLEWKRYQWPFTTEHPWHEAPAGFKREFRFLWRGYDGTVANPYTQALDWFNLSGGTAFFEGWDLLEIGDQLKVEHFAKADEFRRLQDCHVFAVPKRFTNKVAFADIVDDFKRWFKAELKKKGQPFIKTRCYQELLRGEKQWEFFLYCWAKMNDVQKPVGRGTAFELYVQDIYAPGHNLSWQEAYRSKQVQIERDYRDMEILVKATYPRFNWSKLLSAKSVRPRFHWNKLTRSGEVVGQHDDTGRDVSSTAGTG